MYRSVTELTQDEFEELRQAYFYSVIDHCPYDTFSDVPDSKVIENYNGISFVDDDFFCNVN